MATRTLLQLRDRAKQRSNNENSSFVTDAEWNVYLNYSISELRDIIISKVGDDYYAASQDYSLVSGTESYDLPSDFYKILWVELEADDGHYYKIHRYEIAEKSSNVLPLRIYSPDIRYRLRGDDIVVTPISSASGRTMRLWYVPLAPELALDADELKGFNGWDEYIILRAAIMALEKEEQDTSSLSLRLEQLRQRVEAMSANRDQAEPMRIYDNSRGRNETRGDW